MTERVQSRPMNEAERATLAAFLAESRRSVREELSLSFSPWISAVLCFGLVWALAGWLGRVFYDLDFGWHSRFAPWIAFSGVLSVTLLMLPYTVKSLRGMDARRSVVRDDHAAGIVTEEHFHFTEAKRFQEPEHGGLIYFLRTTDDKVFVLFDEESQDLGVDGRDPLTSSFRPQAHLVIVRAPVSRFVIDKTFSGPSLDLPPLRTLSARPEKWPTSDEYCGTSWTQLEAVFSA